MNTVRLKIKCWKSGREELIVELQDEKVVEVNFDKLCPNCLDYRMNRCEMIIEKSPFN